jgi:uncharacterized protein YecT (DUF1311 family)
MPTEGNRSHLARLTACFMVASQEADKDLNTFYGELREHLGSDNFRNLQVAQRLGVEFRDANCTADTDYMEALALKELVSIW